MRFKTFCKSPIHYASTEPRLMLAFLCVVGFIAVPSYIVWWQVPEAFQFSSTYILSYGLFGSFFIGAALLCFDGMANIIGRYVIGASVLFALGAALSQFIFQQLINGLGTRIHYSPIAPLLVPALRYLHPEKMLIGIVVFTAVPLLLLFVMVLPHLQKNHGTKGAHFQTFWELYRRGKFTRTHGFAVGTIAGCWLYINSVALTLVSNPRSGKSMAVIVPSILNDSGSFIVNDNRGELYKLLSGYLEAIGYNVLLWSPYGEQSRGWNKLLLIRWQEQYFMEDLNIICEAIVPRHHDTENASFFRNNAINIIKGLIIYQYLVYGARHEKLNLKAIIELATTENLATTIEEALNDTVTTFSDKPEYLITALQLFFKRIEASKDEKTKSNVLYSAQDYLSRMYSPKALESLSRNDIDIRRIRHEKTAVFIEIPRNKQQAMKPFLTLFYQFFLSNTIEEGEMGENDLRVTCYLDEFGNMARIDDLVHSTTDLGVFGLRFLFVLQNLGQAYRVYGHEDAETILGAGVKMLGTTNNQKDCQHFSSALGEMEIKKTQGQGEHKRAYTIEKPLMKPDAIRRMSKKQWIILPEGEHPIKVKKGFWFKDAELKAMLPEVEKPAA